MPRDLFGGRQQLLRIVGRIEQRAIGIAAVFIRIAEQELAQAAQVAVLAACFVARRALALPVKLGLRQAIGKAEGLAAIHVAAAYQGGNHLKAGSAFGRDAAMPIGQAPRHRVEHGQHVRHVFADAPMPACRVVGFDVAESARLIGVAAHPGDELVRERVDDARGHAQCTQARAGEGHLQDGLRRWIDILGIGHWRLRQPSASRHLVVHPQQQEGRIDMTLVAEAQQALDILQVNGSRRLRRAHSSFSHANA